MELQGFSGNFREIRGTGISPSSGDTRNIQHLRPGVQPREIYRRAVLNTAASRSIWWLTGLGCGGATRALVDSISSSF